MWLKAFKSWYGFFFHLKANAEYTVDIILNSYYCQLKRHLWIYFLGERSLRWNYFILLKRNLINVMHAWLKKRIGVICLEHELMQFSFLFRRMGHTNNLHYAQNKHNYKHKNKSNRKFDMGGFTYTSDIL